MDICKGYIMASGPRSVRGRPSNVLMDCEIMAELLDWNCLNIECLIANIFRQSYYSMHDNIGSATDFSISRKKNYSSNIFLPFCLEGCQNTTLTKILLCPHTPIVNFSPLK